MIEIYREKHCAAKQVLVVPFFFSLDGERAEAVSPRRRYVMPLRISALISSYLETAGTRGDTGLRGLRECYRITCSSCGPVTLPVVIARLIIRPRPRLKHSTGFIRERVMEEFQRVVTIRVSLKIHFPPPHNFKSHSLCIKSGIIDSKRIR